MRFHNWSRICQRLAALVLILFIPGTNPAYAVVGQAEGYDPVQEEALEEFHKSLVLEEKGRDKVQESVGALEQKQKELRKAKGEKKSSLTKEVEELKQQILKLPKRKRFGVDLNGQQIYESNVERRTIHHEEGDSIFDVAPTVLFDLSGRKTDLRFDLSGGKQWNIKFPAKDFWEGSERIRYRRKYFKKVTHSVNSRIARHSSKAIEVNQTRVRWDSNQVNAFNFALSRKFSLNNDTSLAHRYFSNENFDQDSNWQFTDAPSLFWNLTPKSRIALGYAFGASRIRTKAGDANAHEVHLGYFGAVTRKSSLNLDLAFSHQTPRSRESSKANLFKTGAGYIWQLTPKTQMTLQFIRSIQDSTSEIVTSSSGSSASSQPQKTDTHFVNESLSLSLNARLTKKLTTIFTINGSHFRTKVERGGNKSAQEQQWSLPISLTIVYALRRWMTVTTGYTFAYRRGDAKAEEYRSHIFKSAMKVAF